LGRARGHGWFLRNPFGAQNLNRKRPEFVAGILTN
jgi:hypothetical protein